MSPACSSACLLQPRVERLEGALRQRHGFRAERLEIVLRERLGGERRIGRVGGERQVHFSGPPTELESEVDVRTHRFLDALRDLRRRKLGEPSRRGDHGGGDGADPIVVAAEFVCRVRPAVGLALDELLDHRERGGLRAALVFEGTSHGRHAGESNLLGELTADLEVRVDARFNPAEQLHDQPVAIDDRRVALLAFRPADSQPVVRSAKRGKCRRLAAADRTSARLRVLLMAENVEQRRARSDRRATRRRARPFARR